MNIILENYWASVEFPDVNGAEHLEMLQICDRLKVKVNKQFGLDIRPPQRRGQLKSILQGFRQYLN